MVNEIDYDQPGSDFAEFVEILNAGDGEAEIVDELVKMFETNFDEMSP